MGNTTVKPNIYKKNTLDDLSAGGIIITIVIPCNTALLEEDTLA